MLSEYTRKEAFLILGLKEGCSLDEVTKRYRFLIKTFHPDSAGEESTEYVARLNSAYQCIKNNSFSPEKEKVVYRDRTVYKENTVYRDRPESGTQEKRNYEEQQKKANYQYDCNANETAGESTEEELSIRPFCFTGRISRRDFGIEFLISTVLYVILAMIIRSEPSTASNGLNTVFAIIYLLELVSASVRRLRDAGESPFWVLAIYIPLAGIFMLIAHLLHPSATVSQQN